MLTIAGGILIAIAVLFIGGVLLQFVMMFIDGIANQRLGKRLARLRELEEKDIQSKHKEHYENHLAHNRKIAEDREFAERHMADLTPLGKS